MCFARQHEADGDFNVGTTSQADLERLIERERESGVFLSVLGLGTGNLQDSTMELLTDKGNGNYAYLDSIAEARKVLVEEAAGAEPLAELRLRYKQPNGDQSELITFPVVDRGVTLADSSDDFRFAAAVAEFGMLLRDSQHRGTASWDHVKALAEGALGQDRGQHRQEFLALLGKAARLD